MADREEILDALRTIDGVGLPSNFEELVDEGAVGSDSHTIDGDDLASLCVAFKTLFDHFGYDYTLRWSYAQEQPNLKNYDRLSFTDRLRELDDLIAAKEKEVEGVHGI